MSRSLTSRLCAIAITVLSTVAMLGVSFEAEAQRRLGGGNFGRQSPNVMQNRQATPPARAPQTQSAAPQQGAAGTTAASRSAATGAAGATAARSGASRWFGPIAGIAAGLGLAALLSHLGLGAAAAEFLASLLLIAVVVFGALYIFRRLRNGGRQHAMQGAGHGAANPMSPMQRQAHTPQQQNVSLSRRAGAATSTAAAADTAGNPTEQGSWYIPSGFDTQQFLNNAKQQFIALQDAWDKNDIERMREYMTDELVTALEGPLSQRAPGGVTEVVLLTAELLGVENIEDGHLASVRFAGMLRDDSGPEAYRFEEVWNFLKPTHGGWLLAGIQQIPIEYAS